MLSGRGAAARPQPRLRLLPSAPRVQPGGDFPERRTLLANVTAPAERGDDTLHVSTLQDLRVGQVRGTRCVALTIVKQRESGACGRCCRRKWYACWKGVP